MVGWCLFCYIVYHAELYGPVGKLNYVYRIGKCAKPLQNALDVLSFILSPSGCYYFSFNKGLCTLPLHLKFSPAEGAGMSDTHFQQDFLFLTIFRLQKNIITTFYNSELVDNQKIYYRIILLSGKK